MIEAIRQAIAYREPASNVDAGTREHAGFSLDTLLRLLATGACYYLATRTAWALTFPDSKVSLFFPPHAVLVSILLLVPTRYWWAYVLAAAASHFFATQQAVQQDVGEATGRCTDVEADAATRVDLERIEGGGKLVAAA